VNCWTARNAGPIASPSRTSATPSDGALLVDIRSEAQRARHGLIPGAIFHPRNVLEWRCDPSSGFDDPRLSGDLGRRIVLVCHEGYQPSLAAVSLQEVGSTRATDLVGGFLAWPAAGVAGRLGSHTTR
jgi:rhodanese-related sulfurtransferase